MRAKVKMTKDYSMNTRARDGQDCVVYAKGVELTCSEEEAERLIGLGVAKKVAFKVERSAE